MWPMEVVHAGLPLQGKRLRRVLLAGWGMEGLIERVRTQKCRSSGVQKERSSSGENFLPFELEQGFPLGITGVKE